MAVKYPGFGPVNGQYGAPMGRMSRNVDVDDLPGRSVRVFRVPIDNGGYDPGGAYWGLGEPIYCATTDGIDFFCTVRARNREQAIQKLGIPVEKLQRK